MNSIAVIGAGNAGATLAAHVKLLGGRVSLYDAFPEAMETIVAAGNTIRVEGNLDVTGDARIDVVTESLPEAIAGAEIIICTTPAHVHKYVARDIAPHLRAEQVMVLNPGRTGGALEVRKVLAEHGGPEVLVVETQTIAYACRKSGATVHVFGVKDAVPFAGLPAARIPDFTRQIQAVFANFVPAPGGLWQTSLGNIGMLFHPTPTLLNLGRMEHGDPFDYYIDGFSPSVAGLVEKLDTERLRVASAMDVDVPSALDWLKASYGTHGDRLYEALQNNKAYVGIRAPQIKSDQQKKGLRYVIEDVPTGLVPVAELAASFRVNVPTIQTMIDLAGAMFEMDFRATGRTLRQLGLDGMSPKAIKTIR